MMAICNLIVDSNEQVTLACVTYKIVYLPLDVSC